MIATLQEHHHRLMTEALQDDPRVNYAKRIVTCELMAMQLGNDYTCDEQMINIKVADLNTA
jgi:hypothetical protein